jgi:hypothetical protein
MDPGISASDVFRPKWPYPVGMVSGLVFGAGMIAFTIQLLSASTTAPSVIPLVIVACAAAALGVAWFGILKIDQGGFGPAGGSIMLALAIAYMLSQKNGQFSELMAGTIVLIGAFAFCGIGHAFARGAGPVRIIGGVAGSTIAFLLIANHQHWRIDADSMKLCFVVGFGGLGAVGFGASYAFYRLSTAKIDRTV